MKNVLAALGESLHKGEVVNPDLLVSFEELII